MGKTKSSHTEDEEAPKKRGRQSGAKGYSKTALLKIISQFKPTNMVVWATVAEQYRIACGELEPRQPAVIKKFFFKKMCNSMKKPTGIRRRYVSKMSSSFSKFSSVGRR